MRYLAGVVAALMIVWLAVPASACSDCEYKTDFGMCMPKSGCLIPDPGKVVQQTLSLAQALATGDPSKITPAVGAVLLNSPSCLGCSYLAQKVVPNLTPEQLNYVVGQGFFTYLATGGDPLLVAIDVATNLAAMQPIVQTTSNIPLSTPPTTRGQKRYRAEADCLLEIQPRHRIYAAWRGAPKLTEESTGKVFTFPEIDLLPGDYLYITTARVCSEQADSAKGIRALSYTDFNFLSYTQAFGGANLLKSWVIGKKPQFD